MKKQSGKLQYPLFYQFLLPKTLKNLFIYNLNTPMLRGTLSIISILVLVNTQAVIQKILNDNWTLTIVEASHQGKEMKGKELAVDLPTVLHLDLLKYQLIEDPFYRDNYLKIKWISDCDVKYSKKFNVDEEYLNKAIELVFKGIDTYSTIYLNGQQVMKTQNAFREYVVRVDSLVKTENLLEISIKSTKSYDEKGQRDNNMPFPYAHTRKACYQYSWDWAPYLVTMGVWKDVQIRVYDEIKIDYVWARNKVVSAEEAVINFAVQMDLNLFKNDQLSEGYVMGVYLEGTKLMEKNVTEDTVYLDVTVPQPRFWWPNGIGEPNMYDFQVKLQYQGKIVDERKVPYGIRTVQLNLENKQFQVKINGYPVYCKGGNYVPPDMLYPRLTNPNYHSGTTFKKLLDDAVESNFNMIRVWGGGQYQSAEFYQMASRRGIMIFQDFMFSDSVYPSNAEFLENVEEEVKQQVRMIRNYPALAIWCGNNQILQGIQDWGWSSNKYKEDYHKLFEVLIKKILEIQSPDIGYVPSSPVYGVGNFGFQRGGDFHFWGVWAGGSPFQAYQKAVGPFNSEFGTQALPVWHTIKQFTKEEDRSYDSHIFLSHQRHNSQFSTLKNYMSRYMPKSKNFENQAYLSGLVQAFGIQLAIVAQRCAKPKSYGTLYWQFNDAWPAISWSAIDYYGRWKPLQFMAKRIYENLAIFTTSEFSVVALNDYLDPINVNIKIQIMSMDGQVMFVKEESFTMDGDSKKQVLKLDSSIWQGKEKSSFVHCQIWSQNGKKSASTKFFSYFKDLQLPKATISVKINEDTNEITVSSNKLVKNLFIDSESQYLDLSDNYFDLIPNITATVKVQEGSLSSFKNSLKFNSVREASIDESLTVSYV